MTTQPRLLEARRNELQQNDLVARELRERFHAQSTIVVTLVSSTGAGKTTLLERTLSLLKGKYRVAALVADPATENDAHRLSRSGVPVKQITTGTICHLDAAMVMHALDGWAVGPLDLLFIENVGSLVCPVSFDLGEDLRLVLLSVTEGEDNLLKSSAILQGADAAIVTKWDLAEAVEFDEQALLANIQAAQPGLPALFVSAKTGVGMEDYLTFLTGKLLRKLRNAAGDTVKASMS